MVPGQILHRLAGWLCDRDALEQIVEPLLADLQYQWRQAAIGRLLVVCGVFLALALWLNPGIRLNVTTSNVALLALYPVLTRAQRARARWNDGPDADRILIKRTSDSSASTPARTD